jgi:DNA-binding MarR family transcriptional regulator
MKNRTSRHDIARFRIQFMNLFRRLRQEARSDDQSLPKLPWAQLPWAQLSLLGAIERAGDAATPSALAESESMRSSNLAAALRSLETDGLIVRKADNEDRRKVRVRLTKKGRDRLHANIARREHWLAAAVEHTLTDKERSRLIDVGELLQRVAAYSGPSSGT